MEHSERDILNREIERGRKAAEVLNNETYGEAFAIVKRKIIDAWENAPVRDKEGQHELKLMLKMLNEVRAHLEEAMETGKLAKISIQQDETLLGRAAKALTGR